MLRSYPLGVAIVVGTVAASAVVCLALMGTSRAAGARAGESIAYPLGTFRFVERSDRVVTEAELADRVCLVSFIFTRCPLSCPRITGVMKRLQGRLGSSQVLLVSISVDPEYDTPKVLRTYADGFGAQADRWWFLSSTKNEVMDLVHKRFKLPLVETSPAERASGAEALEHSDRIALVDRGVLVGYYDSTDPTAVERAAGRAIRLSKPAWVRALPPINASLNALCAVFLIVGWFLIQARESQARRGANPDPSRGPTPLLEQTPVRGHVLFMILALVTSSIFLACYLVYHFQAGSMPYPGGGPSALVYFTILLSHTLLATLGVVPLVLITLIRAVKRDFLRHVRIARVAFPIWLYVSITGVVIYWMLYQIQSPGSESTPTASVTNQPYHLARTGDRGS